MNNTGLLNRDQDYFDLNQAGFTAREIAGQPSVWCKVADYLTERSDDITRFMDSIKDVHGLRTVFSGAGSSAFIGDSAHMLLSGEMGLRCESVPTTDIVATPFSTLPDVPTLLVSYSRSGESPESIGALQYAAHRVSQLYNIVFVCKSGSSVDQLASGMPNTLVINMPPESCDQGFAMTSSVSGMMLATWCIFGYRKLEARLNSVRKLAALANSQMDALDLLARQAAVLDFDRIVYLGCGALKGLAREGAVKMVELSAGEVNSSWDTPTGFRHGPKSVVNTTTATVHLLSNLGHTRRYDDSLLKEMLAQRKGNKIIAVATSFEGIEGADLLVLYRLDEDMNGEIHSYIIQLLFLQLLAMEKSIRLGKNTDDPCAGGEVNRVVKGIEIFSLDPVKS